MNIFTKHGFLSWLSEVLWVIYLEGNIAFSVAAPTMTQKLRTRKSNDLQMNRLMMDLSDEAQDELSETKWLFEYEQRSYPNKWSCAPRSTQTTV